MMPPSESYDSAPLELPAGPTGNALPPAPAMEAQSLEIPAQSRAGSGESQAAPFPNSEFWSQGMETVDAWEPSDYSGNGLEKNGIQLSGPERNDSNQQPLGSHTPIDSESVTISPETHANSSSGPTLNG